MQSANRFGPLKGHCLQQALIGPNQATGLAGGFDLTGSAGPFYNGATIKHFGTARKTGENPEQGRCCICGAGGRVPLGGRPPGKAALSREA